MKQLLPSCALLRLCACRKDAPNALPAATQDGRNTVDNLYGTKL